MNLSFGTLQVNSRSDIGAKTDRPVLAFDVSVRDITRLL
jgi:hypothetical protein